MGIPPNEFLFPNALLFGQRIRPNLFWRSDFNRASSDSDRPALANEVCEYETSRQESLAVGAGLRFGRCNERVLHSVNAIVALLD